MTSTAPTSTAPLTDERLDEIRELLPKVFSGPWRAGTDPKGFGLIMDNALPVASVSDNLDELLPFLSAAPDLVKELLAEVNRLRVQAAKSDELARDHWRESEDEFDRAAEALNRAFAAETERDDLRQRIANARAEIRKQDTAATVGMRPGYCDVSDALAAVETHLVDPQHRPERHRSPGYPHELPDHAGPADTCAMPVCATARAQHEAVAAIEDLTYELFAGREPEAGA